MSKNAAPPAPLPSDRAEFKRIRAALAKRLRADKVALLPGTLDGLALTVLGVLDEDRATSSVLVGMCYEQFSPLDDDKVRRLQQVIETREDLGNGRVSINGRELDLTK